ncbi:MAG: ribosomal RNA small subunit methyltransferase A [Lentisphaerae bacterium GWF2_44_16]|nr:MAG: ribosomal RNA small subunit methyltransferase A [Lentisphaerae bacterium GWF2_44_16]
MKKSDLEGILREIDFHPGKQLGQNFLVDDNLLDFIARTSAPRENELVLEVGPGFGALTSRLLASGANVTAIEYDRRVCEFLRKRFTNSSFTLVEGDACKVDFGKVIGNGREFRCIANLPYSISSVFIAKMLELEVPPYDMFFMLQKEMGQRLASEPDTGSYGSLSVRTQTVYDVEILRIVPPQVFFPRPNVDSAILHFTRKAQIPDLKRRKQLSCVLKLAFAHRRKKMFKAIAALFGKEKTIDAFASQGISPDARPGVVGVNKFLEFADTLYLNTNE